MGGGAEGLTKLLGKHEHGGQEAGAQSIQGQAQGCAVLLLSVHWLQLLRHFLQQILALGTASMDDERLMVRVMRAVRGAGCCGGQPRPGDRTNTLEHGW